VAGGKSVLAGFWDKIGVNWDGVQYGENADILSFNESFDTRGEERFNALMDNIYNGFVQRVAAGRDMKTENVEEVARGRVWTGAQALDNGLVDETGGLTTAIAAAKRLAGIDADANITLTRFPARLTGWEAFRQFFGTGAETAQTLALINELASSPEARAILKARAEADQAGRVQARSPELELR